MPQPIWEIIWKAHAR